MNNTNNKHYRRSCSVIKPCVFSMLEIIAGLLLCNILFITMNIYIAGITFILLTIHNGMRFITIVKRIENKECDNDKNT